MKEWEILIQKTTETVNNAEFAGFLLEIAEKFEFDLNLESWLIKGSSAEQHFCMRMRSVQDPQKWFSLRSSLAYPSQGVITPTQSFNLTDFFANFALPIQGQSEIIAFSVVRL